MKIDRTPTHYIVDGKPLARVTHVLRTVSKAYYPEDPAAMQFGQAYHQATRFYDESGPRFEEQLAEPLDDRIRGCLNAWKQFRRQTGFKPQIIEKPVVMKALGYAGTPDRFGLLGNIPTLIDLKRSVNIDTPLQMIAYGAGVLLESEPIARLAVVLHDDGTYKIHEYKVKDWMRDWRAWLGVLAYFRYLDDQRRTS